MMDVHSHSKLYKVKFKTILYYISSNICAFLVIRIKSLIFGGLRHTDRLQDKSVQKYVRSNKEKHFGCNEVQNTVITN